MPILTTGSGAAAGTGLRSSSAPVSFYDFATLPMRRDWHVFLGGVVFFFACQFGAKALMTRLSKKFRALPEDDKNTWCVRFVASVNSCLCARTAYLWWTQAHFCGDLYDAIPGQVTSTELIVAYFIWDVIVCVMFKWGFVYTAHGIASGIGTYSTCWPFAEKFHGWLSGFFELSNILMHVAEMLTALETAPALVSALKGLFALLFIIIRPIGGTYIAVRFTQEIWKIVANNFEDCHHPVAPVLCLGVTWTLMALQYAWTGTILRGIGAALGICEAEDLGDAKSPTAKHPVKHEFPPVEFADEDQVDHIFESKKNK